MQLGLQFSVLLASLVVLLSGVEAAPTMKRGGMVTLPLKRITQARDDIHPQVVSSSVYCLRLTKTSNVLAFVASAAAHQPRSEAPRAHDRPRRAQRA